MYDVLVLSMDINLQRKFVRLSDDDKSATYQVFRKWLGSTSINDENWSAIVDEDEAFDYYNLGVGREDSGSNKDHMKCCLLVLRKRLNLSNGMMAMSPLTMTNQHLNSMVFTISDTSGTMIA